MKVFHDLITKSYDRLLSADRRNRVRGGLIDTSRCMMSLDQFIALRAIAKHGSITRAAEELHLTQPALSKQLKLLQEDYHVMLYYKKDGGGIDLTEQGRIFLTCVDKIMADVEALDARFKQKIAKGLAVGGTYALASELLPRLLSEFKKIHPVTAVRLRTTCSFGIHKEILTGDIEVGLVAKTPDSKRLVAERYGKHPLVSSFTAIIPMARGIN